MISAIIWSCVAITYIISLILDSLSLTGYKFLYGMVLFVLIIREWEIVYLNKKLKGERK